MNGEVAQIRDIAIYAKHALKTKSKISYKPDKYENKIEFLFTENFEAKDVSEWYEHCIEKGLESEYQNLSSELLTQIRLALLYSVNEW